MVFPLNKANADAIRVMLVDDSAVIRGFLLRALESERDIAVVWSATDGQAAVDAVRRHEVDVIVLDIEMPRMDGLTAIPLLLAAAPYVKIIMASTLTLKNADISLQALNAGAADYVTKPTSIDMIGNNDFNKSLVDKVRALGAVAMKLRQRNLVTPHVSIAVAQPVKKAIVLRPCSASIPRILAIGSSTGGPQALFQLLKSLRGISQPILITQHMPPAFTTILAEHVKRQAEVDAVEAQNGMRLEGGKVYIAPGDYHMTLSAASGQPLRIMLNQEAPENYCRPSVDVMLRSVAHVYGISALAVILTGMGQDGLVGSQSIVAAGGSVIAQDEATSVVWGMPGAVANAGICSAVLPLADIGPHLRGCASFQPK
jgi:two-component system chemotaxis response regulator CheB